MPQCRLRATIAALGIIESPEFKDQPQAAAAEGACIADVVTRCFRNGLKAEVDL